MSKPVFEKRVIGELINSKGPAEMNTFSCIGDFNRDGFMDIAVCGRHGQMVWFENMRGAGEWEKHLVDETDRMECGGCAVDVNGDGYPDIINGSESGNDEIYWWENPRTTGVKWKKRIIAKTGHGQFHDTAIGDIKGDGRNYLVFTNQAQGTTIYCIPVPKDPTASPWPELEVISSGKRLPNPRHPWNPEGYQPHEGLAIGDIDGDGKNEVICGIHWFKYSIDKWEMYRFTDRYYITTKIAVGDIDGDGSNEIVLSEGDAYIYGIKEGCKLAWFKPGNSVYELWEEHIVETGLFDAHSLQLADLCDNGRLDIFVAEIGVGNQQTGTYDIRPPRLMIYENDGKGNFISRYIIDEGTGTHEAVLADFNNRGVLDIAGKPLHGAEKWKIHVWYNRTDR